MNEEVAPDGAARAPAAALVSVEAAVDDDVADCPLLLAEHTYMQKNHQKGN